MIRIQLVVASALLCVAACSDEGGSGASATAVSVAGRLSSAPAEASDAAVIWSVTSGSDYLYVWGRAEVSGVAFQLELRGRPPAEAINSYGLGVGLILIAPRSLLREGKQTNTDMAMYKRVSGASERHAIIYVDHDQA